MRFQISVFFIRSFLFPPCSKRSQQYTEERHHDGRWKKNTHTLMRKKEKWKGKHTVCLNPTHSHTYSKSTSSCVPCSSTRCRLYSRYIPHFLNGCTYHDSNVLVGISLCSRAHFFPSLILSLSLEFDSVWAVGYLAFVPLYICNVCALPCVCMRCLFRAHYQFSKLVWVICRRRIISNRQFEAKRKRRSAF